jgi:hypothetical protein
VPRENLFAIFCRGRIGFKYRYVLYSNPALGSALQSGVRLVVKVFGKIFRRRIDRGERFDLVDHLVIETLNDVPHHFAQVFEIKKQARLIQFGSRQGHANLVVVTMRILALALVISQVVTCRERIFDRNFEHAPPNDAHNAKALKVQQILYRLRLILTVA